MEKLVIEGNRPISGEVTPQGNKNAALPILASTLLTEEDVVLRNVPLIGDVGTMVHLLEQMGVTANVEDHALRICAREAKVANLRREHFQQIRGSILLAGPLLGRFQCASLPLPGGDRIGRRRVDTHLLALEALGAQIEVNPYGFEMCCDHCLRGADIM